MLYRDIVASKVEICAILKWGMRKLEIFGSFQVCARNFKIAHRLLTTPSN